MTERTNQDYAIEFGEYLAKAAEAYMATGIAGAMLGDAWRSEIDRLRAELYRCRRALEQAQECILGAPPEDCTPEEARADTILKIREALGL